MPCRRRPFSRSFNAENYQQVLPPPLASWRSTHVHMGVCVWGAPCIIICKANQHTNVMPSPQSDDQIQDPATVVKSADSTKLSSRVPAAGSASSDGRKGACASPEELGAALLPDHACSSEPHLDVGPPEGSPSADKNGATADSGLKVDVPPFAPRISVAAIRRSTMLQIRMLSSAKPAPKSSSAGELWPQPNAMQHWQSSNAFVFN